MEKAYTHTHTHTESMVISHACFSLWGGEQAKNSYSSSHKTGFMYFISQCNLRK